MICSIFCNMSTAVFNLYLPYFWFNIQEQDTTVVEHLFMVQWVIVSIPHGGPIELFFIIIHPVLHNWCNSTTGVTPILA